MKLSTLLFCFFSLSLAAQNNKPFTIAIISGANEYVTHITLRQYKTYLEQQLPGVKTVFLQASGPVNEKDEYSELQGTEQLKDCDMLLVFARRTTIGGKALQDVKNFVASGKPIVALRTSSHGFQGWPEFDKTVLGGNYSGHYDGEPEKRLVGPDSLRYIVGETSGPSQSVTINKANKDHPVLKGITNFTSKYSLYKTSPIAPDATLLLTGTTAEGSEPLAWTRTYNGARVVYIALGGFQDFANPVFKKLLTNAVAWAGDIKIRK
jgi:type 1 glutamine amidotransferase